MNNHMCSNRSLNPNCDLDMPISAQLQCWQADEVSQDNVCSCLDVLPAYTVF